MKNDKKNRAFCQHSGFHQLKRKTDWIVSRCH